MRQEAPDTTSGLRDENARTVRRTSKSRAIDKQIPLPLGLSGGRHNLPRAANTCLYCGNAADTRDHVPPKAVLLRPYPANLRTVPSCGSRNASWSLDEQYLAIILAHLTEHPGLRAGLEVGGAIDRALSSAPLLDDRIGDSLSTDDRGVFLTPEMSRIERIVEKVVYGLHSLKYGTGPTLRDFRVLRIFGPGDELPQPIVAAMWKWPGLRRKRWTTVQMSVFSFPFSRGWMTTDAPLYCFIDLADTFLAVVACPPASGKPVAKRLRSKPWL